MGVAASLLGPGRPRRRGRLSRGTGLCVSILSDTVDITMEAARGASPGDPEGSRSAQLRRAEEGRPRATSGRDAENLPAATPSGRPGDGPRPSPAADHLRRSFWWWGRAAFALAAAYLLWQVLLIARSVVQAVLGIILMTAVAVVIAVVFAPVVDALTARARIPRTVATLLIILALLAAVGGLVLLIVNPLVAEGQHLASQLPILQHRLDALRSWLVQRGIQVGTFNLKSLVTSVFGGGSQQATGGILIGAITGTFAVIVDTVVVLVASFWFLRDGRLLRRAITESLPVGWRSQLDFGCNAFAVVIGGYVRGQLLMALMIGAMAGVGSAVIGVPFPLVVAVAAGVFELIPLVGPFVGGAVAGLLALTVSPALVVEVVAVFLVIHFIEGYLVAPRLQGRYVRLHPVIAFLALFTGIEVAGFLGALIAVPLASFAAVMARAFIGDVRAERPELFVRAGASTAPQERRRRELLQRYRIRYRETLRRLLRRRRQR
jgi:predicted PurR-regulated permease PerM